MWKGVSGSLGPWGGGGIARMVVGSQWRSWARVDRAAVMMWWACPFRTMCAPCRSPLVGGLRGGR